jgi:hypothetical protein
VFKRDEVFMMITHSLISLVKDMCEVVNPVPKKKQRSKNLCSTRDLVAKLFIAILVNYAFLGPGVRRGLPKS